MSFQLNGGAAAAVSPLRGVFGAPLKSGSITLPRQSASPGPSPTTGTITRVGLRSSSPSVVQGKAIPVVGPTTPASETRTIPTAVPVQPAVAQPTVTSSGNSITTQAAPGASLSTYAGGGSASVADADADRSRSMLRITGPVSPAMQPRAVSADLLTPSGRMIADHIMRNNHGDEAWSSQGPNSPPQAVGGSQFTPRASLPPHNRLHRAGLADLMKDAMVEAKRQVLTDVDARVTKAMEDVKSLCGELVTEKLNQELDAERKQTAVMITAFQKELEEQKVKERANTTTTLQTLEELAKSSSATNLQLQAELERMQARSELARRDAERLGNDLNELRSWCFNRGPESWASTDPSNSNAYSPSSTVIHELQEEMRQDHMKTKKCISELVCGIEEVAQALASKDQVLNKKMDALQNELQQVGGNALQNAKAPTPSPGSRTCSSAAWPLSTVKETDMEGDSPTLQPASWEQEFARELVTMRMQLEYLQGDVSELRTKGNSGYNSAGSTPAGSFNAPKLGEELGKELDGQDKDAVASLDTSAISEGNADGPNNSLSALTDDVQLLRAQLEERLLLEREERLASDSTAAGRASELAAATGHLSGELTEAKAEVAEALGLVHEAVRLGDFLKREVENERQARHVDIRKLTGRIESLDKASGGLKVSSATAAQVPLSNGVDTSVGTTDSAPKSDTAESIGPDGFRSISPPASSSTLRSPHDCFAPRNTLSSPAGEVARVPQLDLSRAIERQNALEDPKEGSFVSNAPTAIAGASGTSNLAPTIGAPVSGLTIPGAAPATTGSLSAPLGGLVRSTLPVPGGAGPQQQRASWTPTRAPTLAGNMTSVPTSVSRIPSNVVSQQRDRSPIVISMRRPT